jgi:hypothetical protein
MMRRLTLHTLLILARHRAEEKNSVRVDWPCQCRNLVYNFPSAREKMRVHCRGHRSCGNAECFGQFLKWRLEIAMKKNTTLRHTPVFVGQEIDLICNNNFA